MDSQNIILEYSRRHQSHWRSYKMKLFILGLFFAFVGLIMTTAFLVEGIGRELVLLTFLAPMILVILIIYDLKNSKEYRCPQCEVNLTHKNPFMVLKSLKSCPECHTHFS